MLELLAWLLRVVGAAVVDLIDANVEPVVVVGILIVVGFNFCLSTGRFC